MKGLGKPIEMPRRRDEYDRENFREDVEDNH
jgi:hypothetical protein